MTPLYSSYLYHRQNGYRATTSLVRAKADEAKNTKRYPATGNQGGGVWQRLEDMPRYSSTGSRAYYCDNVPNGWRETGNADEIEGVRIHHKGWFTDPDCGGTLRGFVIQITARKGVAQFIAATRHSDWDGITLWPLDRFDNAADAARLADQHAERAAETEREYQIAWRKGQDAAELHNEAINLRSEAMQTIADLRHARRTVDATPDYIARLCNLARSHVAGLLRRIEAKRAKRDNLEREWGNCEGFADGRADG
jgi:hypothetical protein